MAFESGRSAFALLKDWSGYCPNQSGTNQRENSWQSGLEHTQDNREKTTLTAAHLYLTTRHCFRVLSRVNGKYNYCGDGNLIEQHDISGSLVRETPHERIKELSMLPVSNLPQTVWLRLTTAIVRRVLEALS